MNETIKGKTKTGFEFEINENNLENMELLEILAEVDENPLKLPKLLEMMLGKEQKKSLYDHVRLKDNTVPMNAISNEVMDIFSVKTLKN